MPDSGYFFQTSYCIFRLPLVFSFSCLTNVDKVKDPWYSSTVWLQTGMKLSQLSCAYCYTCRYLCKTVVTHINLNKQNKPEIGIVVYFYDPVFPVVINISLKEKKKAQVCMYMLNLRQHPVVQSIQKPLSYYPARMRKG